MKTLTEETALTATEAAELIGCSAPSVPVLLGPPTLTRLVQRRRVKAWPSRVVAAYATASDEERLAMRHVPLRTRGAPKKPDAPAELIEEIARLRGEGWSRDRLAKKYGVPMSRIKRLIQQSGLSPIRAGRRTLQENRAAESVLESSRVAPVMTPVEQAAVILRELGVGTLVQEGDKLKLDGRPISLATALKAAGLRDSASSDS